MLIKPQPRSIKIHDILVCGIIIFSPFANLFLQGSGLGILGASASFPFALLALLYMVVKTLANNKVNKRILLAIAYCTLISFTYSIFIKGTVNTENAYLKGLKYSILYLTALSCAFITINKESLARKSCWCALLICAISLYPPLSDIQLINYVGNSEGRPRGFTMESSHYALIVGAIASILFYLEKSTSTKTAAAIIGLALIIYSQSKAGVLLYCISFFIYYGQGIFEKKSKSKNIALFILALLLVTLVAVPFFLERIQNDIDRYTSTATRVVGIASALNIVKENPLGVGFLGYVEYYLNSIPDAVSLVKSFAPYLDFTEVSDYTKQLTTQSLGTKSFFADSLITFGIPFLIAYLYTFKLAYKRAKRANCPTLIPGIFFIYLSLMFWSSGIGFYIAFLVLAFVPKKNITHYENTNRLSRPPLPA
ncbi:O-antigen ligase family protein [Pseudomonas bubulae]|uniref:O-antigen ligase family protein n=1 Tax=Pseudomonas bubulae TaxID=2316085 RepID=UPI001F333EBA|nr:O-antigen ligase family protein [Pseudomonas bubulae]MCF3195925.1 O-antigen ligase family protein [Pseudomonas bubulae]